MNNIQVPFVLPRPKHRKRQHSYDSPVVGVCRAPDSENRMNSLWHAERGHGGFRLINTRFATRKDAELAVLIVDALFSHYHCIALHEALAAGETPEYLTVQWPHATFHHADLDHLRALLADLDDQ